MPADPNECDPNEWAPVHSSIAGPGYLRCSEEFWYTPVRYQDPKARGLCVSIPRECSNCGWRHNVASSCSSPNCAETLPLSKVTGLTRWRHAPLQEWARRTDVRIRCVTYDHTVGRQCLRRLETAASRPQQVQFANAAADIGGCQVKPGDRAQVPLVGVPEKLRLWCGGTG